MNHWGRPRVCAHACRRTSEPKMKAGDTADTPDGELSHVRPVQQGDGGETGGGNTGK